jgi:hypothetical protein
VRRDVSIAGPSRVTGTARVAGTARISSVEGDADALEAQLAVGTAAVGALDPADPEVAGVDPAETASDVTGVEGDLDAALGARAGRVFVEFAEVGADAVEAADEVLLRRAVVLEGCERARDLAQALDALLGVFAITVGAAVETVGGRLLGVAEAGANGERETENEQVRTHGWSEPG